MNKRLILPIIFIFLLGMGMGNMITRFFTETVSEQATEEYSVASPIIDTCSHVDIVKSEIAAQLEGISDENIIVTDPNGMLEQLITAMSDDKSTITVKHKDYTIEYIVISNLKSETKAYIKSSLSKGTKLNQMLNLLRETVDFVHPGLTYSYQAFLDASSVETDVGTSIKARARSPGHILEPVLIEQYN